MANSFRNPILEISFKNPIVIIKITNPIVLFSFFILYYYVAISNDLFYYILFSIILINFSNLYNVPIVIHKKTLIKIVILLLSLTSIFTLITIYKLPTESEMLPAFLTYFKAYFNFIKSNISLLISIIALWVFCLAIKLKQIKRKKERNSFTYSYIIATVNILFFSLILSYLVVFIYSIFESKKLLHKIETNPAFFRIIWDKEKILEEIKSKNELPKLIEVDNSIEKKLLESILAHDHTKSNFYKQKIIKSIPNILINTPTISQKNIILYRNYLFITNISEDNTQKIDSTIIKYYINTELTKYDMEEVIPTIVRLYLKQIFPPNYIKEKPTVKIITKEKYTEYIQQKAKAKIKEIDKYYTQLQDFINKLYKNIKIVKQHIENNKMALKNALNKKDYKVIEYYKREISIWEKVLDQYQKILSESLEDKKILEEKKERWENLKNNTHTLKGLFEKDKNTILIILDSSKKVKLEYYILVLTHEYLHYTSSVPKKELPTFFEESLTEYFTIKVVKKINPNFNQFIEENYLILIKVLQEMMKKIPEKKFEQIYFTKDKKLLIQVLNEAYGNNFYTESNKDFQNLSPDATLKDLLKSANNIINRIGGEKIKEEDLQQQSINKLLN